MRFLYLFILVNSLLSIGVSSAMEVGKESGSSLDFLSLPPEIQGMILERTDFTPLQLNKLRLVSEGFKNTIDEIYTHNGYIEKFPHYVWEAESLKQKSEVPEKRLPKVKDPNESLGKTIVRYQEALQKIIFRAELSKDEKITEIDQLNRLFLYDSKLIESLIRKVDSTEDLNLTLSRILTLHYSWIGIASQISAFISFQIHPTNAFSNISSLINQEVINIIGSHLLDNLREVVNEVVWDNTIWHSAGMEMVDNVNTSIVDNVKKHVASNTQKNSLGLLEQNSCLQQIDFQSEGWKSELNEIIKFPVLYAFSEYLFAAFLYLEDVETYRTLNSKNLEIFKRYSRDEGFAIDKKKINSMINPCTLFLERQDKLDHGNDEEDVVESPAHSLIEAICRVMAG